MFESGWSFVGEDATTKENAQIYNLYLINHIRQGTPKRPKATEAYIFAMFNMGIIVR